MEVGSWAIEIGLGFCILMGFLKFTNLSQGNLPKNLQSLLFWADGQTDPYRRLESIEELQRAVRSGVRIDVNRATVDDWLRLPGISIHQARSLVDLSKSGVQFHDLEDLAAALSLSVQQLQPLAPILQFCYYDPASLNRIQPIDANRAAVEELIRIPSIDLYLARVIVRDRQAHGPFQNIADLQRRIDLPAQLTAELMHFLQF